MARTVLIVDDEMLIAMMLKDAFRDNGFEVLCAHDGATATVCPDGARPPDALVTDIRVGDQSGWDLADHARARTPDIAVVYISGDSGSQWPARGVSGSAIVAKPFAGTAVVEFVRERLAPDQGAA